MKLISASNREIINEEGIIHYPSTKKFIVRVKIKTAYHSLKAFNKEQDAIDFYKNWLLENR
ncbi:MAG: hypothetical protein WCL51_18300 [Bacteroidota bacterium]